MSTVTPAGAGLGSFSTKKHFEPLQVDLPEFEREFMEDVGFMNAMTLITLGNYAQTGHFGGPLAYTPYNVAIHLGGPELGGLRYDIREPKHPYADKFMLAGGHCIPTCYALWMILYQALLNHHEDTGDDRFRFDPRVAVLPIDGLGFRRSAGVCATMLQDNGLADHPLFAQAGLRGIRALAGHSETTDATNDVNGGPPGSASPRRAGKAMFWDAGGGGPQAEDPRLRGRVRLHRRPRPGAQDRGAGPAGGQAPEDSLFHEQLRHRRPSRRRRRARPPTTTICPASGRRTAGTCSRWRTATISPRFSPP